MPSRKNVSYKASGRKRIVHFEQDTGTTDSGGGRIPNWTAVTGLSNVPIEILSWSPYMQFQAQQLYPGTTSRATMRYRKSAPVVAGMRAVSGNHIYQVRGVLNYDENDEVVQLYLEELQAVGSVR